MECLLKHHDDYTPDKVNESAVQQYEMQRNQLKQ